MIEEFKVYVITDENGKEMDRFFHSALALDAKTMYEDLFPFATFTIVCRLVTYSE